MNPYERAYELMQEIYENFSRVDKLWFLGEDPCMMHHTLGRHLRNHANLWQDEWEPELVEGVDHSPNHPDAISSKVIEDFQKFALEQEASKRKEEED